MFRCEDGMSFRESISVKIILIGFLVGVLIGVIALITGARVWAVVLASMCVITVGTVLLLLASRRERDARKINEDDIMTDEPWL